MPSLSLCMLTRGPAARVEALLELCRPAVDEIVLAVDGRGDVSTLDACAGLAERRHLVESGSIVHALGWLLNQCSGDWILRLDDDEVPSRELLARLPAVIADRRPTNIVLPRRWLFRSPREFIVTPPWQPDHQVRLVRNVPGIWSFPGLLHEALRVPGDRRLADLPIYHADCLLSTEAERGAKRDRFERVRPGHHNDGFPVNEMYVPERHDVDTAAVPPADAHAIERVLGGAPRGIRRPLRRALAGRRGRVVHVAEAELHGYVATRTPGPGAYRARVRLGPPGEGLLAGAASHHAVVVENLGDELWPREAGPPVIQLGYRWLDRTGDLPAGPEGRTPFTEAVPPGATTRAMLGIVAPARPGRYLLEVDVVHDGVGWFGGGARIETDVLGGSDADQPVQAQHHP